MPTGDLGSALSFITYPPQSISTSKFAPAGRAVEDAIKRFFFFHIR